MLIYIIANDINDKVYIGQTTKSLKERISSHRNSLMSGSNHHIYNAMRKYGWDNFHFSILEDNIESKDKLDEREAYYIDKYDSIKSGYNMIPGGSSINPMFYEKVKESHLRSMQSEDVRSRISEKLKAITAISHADPEYRKKMSDITKNRYNSPQGDIAREKFRKSYVFTPEHQEAAIRGRRKSVYCIDSSGNAVHKFSSVKSAAEWWWNLEFSDTVKDPSQICDKIKRSYKNDEYISGLKWIYEKKGDSR